MKKGVGTRRLKFLFLAAYAARDGQISLNYYTIPPATQASEHSTRISFFFFSTQILSFRIQPQTISPRFYKLMKLNKINELWNSANSLFKWRFRFVVFQKFSYHGNVT